MLVFCFVFSFLAPVVGAGGDYDYEITDDGAVITEYTGSETEVEIPDELGGEPVVRVDNDAFKGAHLNSIVFPDSVEEIGRTAFEGNFLYDVTIGDDVDIEQWGMHSRFKDFYTSNDKRSGDYRWEPIPSGMWTYLDAGDPGVFEVALDANKAEGVQDMIGGGTYDEGEIVEIDIETAQNYEFIEWQEAINVTGPIMITGHEDTPSELEIPKTMVVGEEDGFEIDTPLEDGEAGLVTQIGWDAFTDNGINELYLPDSLIEIGGYAFKENNLTELDIPDSVEIIYEWGFIGNNITDLTLRDGLEVIGSDAFHRNNLEEVDIPESVVSIGDGAFSRNYLTEVTIPGNVDYLSGFADNNLTSINIEEGVEEIGRNAFKDNELEEITIPASVERFGSAVFRENNFDNFDDINFVEPDNLLYFSGFSGLWDNFFEEDFLYQFGNLEVIGESAFAFVGLSSIDIPDGVIEIDRRAFRSNYLTDVEIPESVQLVREEAFVDNHLESVAILGEEVYFDVDDSWGWIVHGAFAGNPALEEVLIGADAEFHSALKGGGANLFSLGDFVNTYIDNDREAGLYEWDGDEWVYQGASGMSMQQSTNTSNETLTTENVGTMDYSPTNFSEIEGEWIAYGNPITEKQHSFEADANKQFLAIVEPLDVDEYEVTLEADPEEGAEELIGAGTYYENEEVTIDIDVAEGYEFIEWQEDGEQYTTEQEFSFDIEQDRDFTAILEEVDEYEVTLEADPSEGADNLIGAGTYEEGEEVTIDIDVDSNYNFVEWQEDEEKVTDDKEYIFNIEEDRDFTAILEEEEEPTPEEYEVTLEADPEEGADDLIGEGAYEEGEEVTIDIDVEEGYDFIEWQEDEEKVTNDKEYTFDIEEDRHFKATLEVEEYEVTLEADPDEGAEELIGEGSYEKGEEVAIDVDVAEDYNFVEWQEEEEQYTTDKEYTFDITEDRTFTAILEEERVDEFEVTLEADPEDGARELTGAGTYEEGERVEIVAYAEEGYEFVEWREGEDREIPGRSYTFDIDEDKHFVAVFEEEPELPQTTGVAVAPIGLLLIMAGVATGVATKKKQ